MTAAPGRVPAVGGTRTVRAPDSIARDYLLLGLRLDQHIAGLVDGYFGPADLKGLVETESLPDPARLRDDAQNLLARLAAATDGKDPQLPAERRDWLTAQVTALETHATVLAGEDVPYPVLVERAMGFAPPRRPEAVFTAALHELDASLPGDGPVTDRLVAWDMAHEVPVERLSSVIDWLVDGFRSRARDAFGLPAGEGLRVSLVRGQPWSGYCWYDGGLRSRVDVNVDLPIRGPDLVHTMAHETYPGHHLEHAWKEADLVERQGRLESSILLINTPECVISEGMADLGTRFAVPPDEAVNRLEELFTRAGLAVAADLGAARATAERAVAIAGPRRTLAAIRGNAAYLRHLDGRSHDEVLAYLQDVGGYAPDLATKRLEFIEHPLWRTYVFAYAEGEAMLSSWLERVAPAERVARFGRLLHEQLTPRAILGEVG